MTDKVLTFRVRQLVTRIAVDQGLLLNPDRLEFREQDDIERKAKLVDAVFRVATMETPIYKYPRGWWQMFKSQHFPGWLRKRFPVRYTEVIALHKFPEIDLPTKVGREFVHIKTMDYDDFVKEFERRGESPREDTTLREVWGNGCNFS